MAMAAGVTPGMRAACPSVSGRTRSSFSRISRDKPGMPPKPKVARDRSPLGILQPLDLPFLLRDIAVVFDLGLHGGEQTAHRFLAQSLPHPAADFAN